MFHKRTDKAVLVGASNHKNIEEQPLQGKQPLQTSVEPVQIAILGRRGVFESQPGVSPRKAVDSDQERNLNMAHSTPVSFFKLPKAVRINIYKRILVLKHPIYIFQEPGSMVESFPPDKPIRWLALLQANRTMYTESSAILYSMNKFHFEDITPLQVDLLQSFLDTIGPTNAASLSYLCVNFPVVERTNRYTKSLELRSDSLQGINLYRDRCAELSTLELHVHYKNSTIFRQPDEFFHEALLLIDTRLRKIPSLRQIVIRFVDFKGIPTASAKDVMQELGWIVVLPNEIQ